jgi:hypothetical protein
MDAVPVTLRLRGTFIDFGPDVESGIRHVRSTSEPACNRRNSESSDDDEYLSNLIAHTRILPKVYLPSKFQERESELGNDSEDLDDMSTKSPTTTVSYAPYDCMNSGSDDDETFASYIASSRHCNSDINASQGPWHCSGDIESEQDPSFGMHLYNSGCGMLSTGVCPITTLMICDIPCRTSEHELTQTLTMLGFRGTYDFLYVPVKQRGRRHRGNLGYAFVNFKRAEDASRFAAKFVDFTFPGCNSKKVSYVKPAACQGYEANVRMHDRNKRFQKYQRAIIHDPR